MRIVRVAPFSFITQVERQLCIVNQGYPIVTKQQRGDDQTNKFRLAVSIILYVHQILLLLKEDTLTVELNRRGQIYMG
jgi:hypothetical protein